MEYLKNIFAYLYIQIRLFKAWWGFYLLTQLIIDNTKGLPT